MKVIDEIAQNRIANGRLRIEFHYNENQSDDSEKMIIKNIKTFSMENRDQRKSYIDNIRDSIKKDECVIILYPILTEEIER